MSCSLYAIDNQTLQEEMEHTPYVPITTTLNQTDADRQMDSDVRLALVADYTLSNAARSITIISRDGVVALRGVVESEMEKANVELKARGVSGVIRVDNQLTVRGRPS